MKKTYFNDEMKNGLLKGMKIATESVASTLGPAGRTVLIEKSNGNFVFTKDGISVLKELNDVSDDNLTKLGARLITTASGDANAISGDGSTTTAILTEAIISEGIKAIDKGTNPIKLKQGINNATSDILAEIDNYSIDVDTKDQIERIATISANDDEDLGKLIADCIDKVGENGIITLSDSKTSDMTVEYVEGMKWNNTVVSPYMFTDLENMTVSYENPYILITNKKLSSTNEILPLLDKVNKAGASLVIIAPEISGELLTTLIVNDMKGTLKVIGIKPYGFGDNQTNALEDLAILTGTTVIDENLSMQFNNVFLEDLGSAREVKCDSNSTTIVDGNGDSNAITERINLIKKQISECNSKYEKEKLQDRLAKLDGGVCVINIGAKTESEVKELRDRVEDAVNASRAACEGGIIAGGGSTFAHISKKLENQTFDDDDVKTGYNIVVKAITKPIKQLSENAGICGDVVLNKVQSLESNFGYDVLNDEYCNMLDNGIIDPTKVAKISLENAVSIATLTLTSNCGIVNIKEKQESALNL